MIASQAGPPAGKTTPVPRKRCGRMRYTAVLRKATPNPGAVACPKQEAPTLLTVDSHDQHLAMVCHMAESVPAIVNYLKALLGDPHHNVR